MNIPDTRFRIMSSLILVSVFIINIVLSTKFWSNPQGFIQNYMNNQQIISYVIEHQQQDGFIVFTANYEDPQYIPDTYLGMGILLGLHSSFPKKEALKISLQQFEQEAIQSLQQSHPIFGPRELYEDFMLRKWVGLPVDRTILSIYQQRLSTFLSTSAFSTNISYVHDWYYAILALMSVGSINNNLRSILSHEIQGLKYLKGNIPFISESLVIDGATMLGLSLDNSAIQLAKKALQTSWDQQGGFITYHLPDILSTYFAVILAWDVGYNKWLHIAKIQDFLATLRGWNGYRIISNASVDPLATAYAITLRMILAHGNVQIAPR